MYRFRVCKCDVYEMLGQLRDILSYFEIQIRNIDTADVFYNEDTEIEICGAPGEQNFIREWFTGTNIGVSHIQEIVMFTSFH